MTSGIVIPRDDAKATVVSRYWSRIWHLHPVGFKTASLMPSSSTKCIIKARLRLRNSVCMLIWWSRCKTRRSLRVWRLLRKVFWKKYSVRSASVLHVWWAFLSVDLVGLVGVVCFPWFDWGANVSCVAAREGSGESFLTRVPTCSHRTLHSTSRTSSLWA